jgi:lipooligosaccharide transport system permease protein
LYRFAIIPMFLFSGTFFPVSQLPKWLEVVAYCLPLFHGVSLCRDLTLGQVSWADVGHVAYLCALVGVGYAAGRKTFAKRLVV